VGVVDDTDDMDMAAGSRRSSSSSSSSSERRHAGGATATPVPADCSMKLAGRSRPRCDRDRCWRRLAPRAAAARGGPHSNAINLRIPPEPGALRFRLLPQQTVWPADQNSRSGARPVLGLRFRFCAGCLPIGWVCHSTHSLSLRGACKRDVGPIMKLLRAPPWWGLEAMPAPPGHRCDQTSLPARPQGATFTGQPAGCSRYTAVTLNKPLDFERGQKCFARNSPTKGSGLPRSRSWSGTS
jgi:hypothetical protein